MTTLQDRAHDKAAERFTADPMPTQEEAFGWVAWLLTMVLAVVSAAVLIGVVTQVLPLFVAALRGMK